MNNRLVVDSWAWVEYLRGSRAGEKVNERLSGADELWTSAISLAEVTSKYRRAGISERVATEAILSLSRLGMPGSVDSIEAGRIHAEIKPRSPNFGLADSFVLQLARKVGARVVTGDPDFENVPEADLIEP